MNNYQKMTIKNLWSRIQHQRNLDFGSYGRNKWIHGKEWLKKYRKWKKSEKIYGFRIWQCDKDNYIAYRGRNEKIKIYNIENAEYLIRNYLIKNNKFEKKQSNIIKIRVIENINDNFHIYYFNYNIKNNKKIEFTDNEINNFNKEISKLKNRKIKNDQVRLTGTKENIIKAINIYFPTIKINKIKFYENKGEGFRVYLKLE